MKNSKFMHQDMYPAVLFFAFSFYKNVVVHHCHGDKRTFHHLSYNIESGYHWYCLQHFDCYTASLHQGMWSKVNMSLSI